MSEIRGTKQFRLVESEIFSMSEIQGTKQFRLVESEIFSSGSFNEGSKLMVSCLKGSTQPVADLQR